MRNIDACLYVRPSDRTTLERLVGDGKTPHKIVARARIVLLSGRGLGTNSIQREAQRQTQANSILEKNARGRRALEEAVSRVSNE
jgi:hypothetical protein